MRVGLNGIGFEAGRMGGTETFFRDLVHSLQAYCEEPEITVLCNPVCGGEFPLLKPASRAQVVNLSPRSFKWYVRGILRNLLDVDLLNPEVYRSGVDLIHHPFTLLSPSCSKLPSVVTFHDLQHEFYPEYFSKSELFYRRRNYRQAAQKSTRLIASSAYTKGCLIERYGVQETKIDVVHLGLSRQYGAIEDQATLEAARQKLRLDRPFLYYPAATWPHKNHRNLFLALRILKERYRFDGQLVLSGIAMQRHARTLQDIESLGLSGSVRLLGYLPYEELPLVYNLATMLVFPSRFEGFGLPLVEAMACGCPVACSNVTSMPEVVGVAGETFDPESPEEIAETIWRVWDDPALAARMKLKGVERARDFGWSGLAAQTAAVYRKAVR